ncbi:MAG: hypothetical protein PHI11_03740 [Gallionella sp.]|nr:hypothetical protein [Gallionella sp.]
MDKQSNSDIFDYEDIKHRDPAGIDAERSGSCTISTALIAPGCRTPTSGLIMKTYKAIKILDARELMEVTVSDPAIRAWSKKTGNDVLSIKADKGLIIILLRKNKIAPVAAPAVANRDTIFGALESMAGLNCEWRNSLEVRNQSGKTIKLCAGEYIFSIVLRAVKSAQNRIY